MEYVLERSGLYQGALEIRYIEEFFLDFPRKKSAAEVIQRLANRDHRILMAEAALSDEPGTFVPVSFKVAHELRAHETEFAGRLADLVAQLEDCVEFNGRRVLYQWIGGTRSGLAGPGPLPCSHRRAGSLGDGQRLRRNHREDEEPVLRDAQHACATPLRYHPVRASPRGQPGVEALLQEAARPARDRCAPEPPFRGSHQLQIYRPRWGNPRLGAYRHIGNHQWLRARKLFVAEGRFVVERLLTLSTYKESSPST